MLIYTALHFACLYNTILAILVHPFEVHSILCDPGFYLFYISSPLQPNAKPQAGANVLRRSPPCIQYTKPSIVPAIKQLKLLLGKVVYVRLRGWRQVRDDKSPTLETPRWLTPSFERTGSREYSRLKNSRVSVC